MALTREAPVALKVTETRSRDTRNVEHLLGLYFVVLAEASEVEGRELQCALRCPVPRPGVA